jgi:hypothetical protein
LILSSVFQEAVVNNISRDNVDFNEGFINPMTFIFFLTLYGPG